MAELHIYDMPDEVIEYIFDFLDIVSLDKVRKVCILFDDIADKLIEGHFSSTHKDTIYASRQNFNLHFGSKHDDPESVYKKWELRMMALHMARDMYNRAPTESQLDFYQRSVQNSDSSRYGFPKDSYASKTNEIPPYDYDYMLKSNYIKTQDDVTHDFQHLTLRAEINGIAPDTKIITKYQYSPDGSSVTEVSENFAEKYDFYSDERTNWRLNRPDWQDGPRWGNWSDLVDYRTDAEYENEISHTEALMRRKMFSALLE
jgi:hypothetical protein